VADLDSSAPHLAHASSRTDLIFWGAQAAALEGRAQSSGLVLYKGPNGQPEAGLVICTPGRWRLAIPRDKLCHFVAGHAEYCRDNGERIAITPGTLVLFPAHWSGECTVHETLRSAYILTADPPAGPKAPQPMATPYLREPLSATDLIDWGFIPTLRSGTSRTSGKLLYKGPEGRSECGIWRCTPGEWFCNVTRDEFCHFLAGRCTYVHESGEVIEITPDTAAFFAQNWNGVCTVHETVTKVYLIR